MKKVYLSIITILGSSLMLFAGNGDEDKKKKDGEKKEEVKTEQNQESTTKPDEVNPLTFSGYVDTYYFYNTNGVSGRGSNLGASGFERIFDQNANSFQVGLAQLKTTYTKGSVTGVIDLVFGNNADLGNYGNVISPLSIGDNPATSMALALKQAYVSWAINDKFTLTAGQFGTNVGYEVIDAPVNFNYSLSNLFGNGPFYHTGIKMDMAVSDNLAFMVGINDGLDSKDDNNKAKGISAQVFVSPVENWSLYVNYFGSNEGTKDDPYKYKWFDITTSYQITDKFLLGLNAVPYGAVSFNDPESLGKTATKSWKGIALYANTKLTEKFALGIRAEHFDNSQGGIYLVDENGGGVKVNSITLTGNFDITENLMFKPEFRMDAFKNSNGTHQLMDKNGAFTKDSQSTIGGALIFYF